ncbi:MAG: hypothetical protein AUJ56_03005 [Zetaproteobacteria bacterium CG1_02_49_23]|nr:MAG: hypothetical protein AUJ56_03005 [Zetaproteobacteria bacterium CG1_02_49_23]
MNKIHRHLCLAGLLSLLNTSTGLADETLMVGDFAHGNLSAWEANSFVGTSVYKPYEHALDAVSNASASGLLRKIRVDLNKTPILNWSWMVSRSSLLDKPEHDERSKHGDDYPVRIYIIIDGGWAFWKTHALNYVWSANQPSGTHWQNAFTSNAIMLAVDSGQTAIGSWQQHKRNIRQDLQQYLAIDTDYIDAIAIMSDTDNTGGNTHAAYGNIFFHLAIA